MRLQPAGEVVGAPGQATGRGTDLSQALALGQHLLVAEAAQARIQPRMRLRAIGGGEAVGFVAHCRLHAQRLEDAVADEAFPGLPAGGRNHFAGDDVEDVVVGVVAAEAGGRLDVAQRAHDVGAAARTARDEQQVAGTQAQSAAVDQQIAHGHLAGHPRIVHAEIG